MRGSRSTSRPSPTCERRGPASDPRLLHTQVDLPGTLADIGQPGRAAELIAEVRPHLGSTPALQAKAAALTRELNLDHRGSAQPPSSTAC